MATADTRPGLNPELARTAFASVISDPSNNGLLERVRYTFEHRRQFAHLPDAKRGGLRLGLQVDLATFAFPSDREPEAHERHPIDRNFKRRLRRAGDSIANNPDALAAYTRVVDRQGRDVSTLTAEEVAADFKQALTNYSADPKARTSIDW